MVVHELERDRRVREPVGEAVEASRQIARLVGGEALEMNVDLVCGFPDDQDFGSLP